MRRSIGLFWVVQAFLFGGCDSSAATEVVVVVAADEAVLARASSIDMRVLGRSASESAWGDVEPIAIPATELPFQFSMSPAGGDATRRWRVLVSASESAGLIVTREHEGGYVRGESRVLEVWLSDACGGVACGEGETCIGGACAAVLVDAGTLPAYAGGRVDPMAPPVAACSGDGDCDDGRFCNGVERCLGGDAGVACAPGEPPCGMDEICNDDTDTCTMCDGECPTCMDVDMDGFEASSCGGADCDDTDPDVHPDATEVCDGVDNNCAGGVDEGLPVQTYYVDGDGDGYGTDAGSIESCDPVADRVTMGGDCADGDGDVNPGEAEVCDDLVDNNCVDGVDEGCSSGPCSVPTGGVDPEVDTGGCAAGQSCAPSGGTFACTSGNFNAVASENLGAFCTSDADCWSPFGYGVCGRPPGGPDGQCVVLHCGEVPSACPSPNGVCAMSPEGMVCHRACTSPTECRSGYDCMMGACRPPRP